MTKQSATLIGVSLRDRERNLLRGLAGRSYRTAFWPPATPDPRAAPLREGLIELAAQTARRQARGKLESTIKKLLLRGQYNSYWRRLARLDAVTVASWNGSKGHRLLAMNAAHAHSHQTLYLELAPLPGRITVDLEGINHAGSLPKRPDFYLAWMDCHCDVDHSHWRSMRDGLSARVPSRSDISQVPAMKELRDRQYVFCPLQVPGDTQLTLFGDWSPSVEGLISSLHVASSALPAGWHLRIKEHPSSRAPSEHLQRVARAAGERIEIDNCTDTFEQVAHAGAVVTVNSSVGLQALFWDKPVINLGHAFWGIAGVSTKATSTGHLATLLSDPLALSYDARLRNAFMSYCNSHFPVEEDVISGRVTLDDITKRDIERDRILNSLQSA